MDNKQLAALLPGDIIQCPNCEIEIAKIIHPIFIGDIIKADYFEWLNVKYEYGDALDCYNCSTPFGMDYGKGHQLHVKGKGWIP